MKKQLIVVVFHDGTHIAEKEITHDGSYRQVAEGAVRWAAMSFPLLSIVGPWTVVVIQDGHSHSFDVTANLTFAAVEVAP